ncbi:FAD-linked sulfhydryl oxidase ALR [Uranotaenia lowii]|uniref:FAD-linked sulfhydryl oxidase ALR n=1 Tax=Uranotaenia lowii TaxID=190385 RepID=UPI00247AD51D|nr:FAD-linked sulfhydryl oxidase ALR [Uranotaenia lowii]
MPVTNIPTEGSTGTAGREPAPCRTCVDFKSWSKQQRKTLTTTTGVSTSGSDREVTKSDKSESSNSNSSHPPKHCPLDKDKLGRYTWSILHTTAAYYPDEPSNEDQCNVRSFFTSFAQLYPCEYCAKDFQDEIKKFPPETKSQHALAQWLCRMHNRVNAKLGKPQFDCAKVDERWRDGPPDGSCD